MRGYDKVVATAPRIALAPVTEDPGKRFEREVKEYCSHAGFDEIMTYAFYGEKDIASARLPLEAHLELENPLNPDQKYLALSTVPLFLRKAGENLRHFDAFDCFEWGRAFAKDPKTHLPAEVSSLGLFTVLPKKSARGEAFLSIKGKTLAFLEALRIDTEKISWELPEKFPHIPVLAMLHPTRSAVIAVSGKPIGIIGEFHPQVLRNFGLEPRLAMAGFVTEDLRMLRQQEILFAPLQKFPNATRDISLVVPRKTTVSQVEELFREAGAPLLTRFELFDIYEKDEEKSLAFHLFFGAPDRTLKSEEMDAVFDRIVALANERLGGGLRN